MSGALAVFQLGNSKVVHKKTFLFETFCCSWHVLFQRAPDQKQNRKIVITSTDQVTQFIIRNYEAGSFCMAESGLQEPWIKVMTLYFQVWTNKPS